MAVVEICQERESAGERGLGGGVEDSEKAEKSVLFSTWTKKSYGKRNIRTTFVVRYATTYDEMKRNFIPISHLKKIYSLLDCFVRGEICDLNLCCSRCILVSICLR